MLTEVSIALSLRMNDCGR